MDNPLLSEFTLPPFSSIEAKHIEPAVDRVLKQNRQFLDLLLKENKNYSWDTLIAPWEEQCDLLNRIWSPANHLHSVADNPELRQAYNNCLPKLTDYGSELGQHEGLYKAILAIRNSAEFDKLEPAQRKIIDNELRDFKLAGIALDPEQQQKYKEVKQKLSRLQTRFEENLLDATEHWSKLITDESDLGGLPDSVLALAAQQAEKKGKKGWLFNLEFPSYFPLMQYADNRELREEVYEAYVTRASENGPGGGEWDNGQVMADILALRKEQANLLGFANYAEYSLQRKMASSPAQILNFLQELAQHSSQVAQDEYQELSEFALDEHQLAKVEAWDVAYYSEKLRKHKFDISQEQLRPYFPAPHVIKGMFAVVKKLYDIDIRAVDDIDTWHDDVTFYEIHDSNGVLRGRFYLDLYARSQKRGGAWMDECVVRRKSGTTVQTPVAYLTCNFTPPVSGEASLLTHDEVITLFHEFGHGLHHMLTLVDYADVSGINGVAWDAVELPSQFMENWCWEREALELISSHYQSGESLPEELYEKLTRSKTFQSGMQMVRQLEFALFDFRLHLEERVLSTDDIQILLDEIRTQVAVIIPPVYNRFQHGFSHIFAGGYAAGYYSYKWAEVLSADAFSKFEENGIFDRSTGVQFLNSVLEQGGAREPMESFVEFRGREPSVDALLRHSGIVASGAGTQT